MAELIDKTTHIQVEDTGEAQEASLTVRLNEQQMRQLRERAARLGVAPEDLARIAIQNLLRGPDEEFRRAIDFVIEENAELYRRLA